MRFGFLFLVALHAAGLGLVAGCGGNVVVSGSGGPGGGSGGEGGGPAGGNGPGIVHASCGAPTPEPMPPEPVVNVDSAGRPKFDLWRDLDCDAVSQYLCDPGGGTADCPSIGGAMCLTTDPQTGGVCANWDSDLSCDGEGEILGYGYGACWLCAPIEAHAAACCAGLAGFDCRAWPYPSNGAPGTTCARHADCEPGLVCGAPAGGGYGICQCPETPAGTVKPTGSCGF